VSNFRFGWVFPAPLLGVCCPIAFAALIGYKFAAGPTALTNGASPVWGANASNPCAACNNGGGGPGFCSECKVAAKARGNAYDLDWTYTLGRPVNR
jgi:hypothetical protein